MIIRHRIVVAIPLLLVACASTPTADSPEFGATVAVEASRLANAQTPEEKVSVLLDILDERVDQMERLGGEGRQDFTARLAASYRRLGGEALNPALAKAPTMAAAARDRLRSQETRLARLPEARDALAACREILRSLAAP